MTVTGRCRAWSGGGGFGGREGASDDGKGLRGEVSQSRHLQWLPENMINGLFNVRIHSFKTRQDIEGLGCKSQYWCWWHEESPVWLHSVGNKGFPADVNV